MTAVARRSRPKPTGAFRKQGRHRRTLSPSRRPNEKSPTGREKSDGVVVMNSPG